MALRAYDAFRRLLDVSGEETVRLRYELNVLPAPAGFLALAGGAVLTAAAFFWDPLSFGLSPATPAGSWVVAGVIATFNTATLVAFLLHALRQLRGVDRLHARAEHIDLLNPAPVYAFSTLTAGTGVGLVLFSWFLMVQDPTPGLNPVSLLGVTSLSALGAASFVLPLQGMHQRLVLEKDRLTGGVAGRLSATFDRLHDSVDTGNMAEIGEINQAVAALKLEWELVDGLPTWPWRPQTVRGFVTAVVLPLLLWLITRLLEQLVIGP